MGGSAAFPLWNSSNCRRKAPRSKSWRNFSPKKGEKMWRKIGEIFSPIFVLQFPGKSYFRRKMGEKCGEKFANFCSSIFVLQFTGKVRARNFTKKPLTNSMSHETKFFHSETLGAWGTTLSLGTPRFPGTLSRALRGGLRARRARRLL